MGKKGFFVNDRRVFNENPNKDYFYNRNWRGRFDRNDRRNNYEFYNRNGGQFGRNNFQPKQGFVNTESQRPNNFYNKFENKYSEMKTCLRCTVFHK